MSELQWQCDERAVTLDGTMAFGHGYDFFGLDELWQEAHTPNDKYLIWPNNGKWSLYSEKDGGLAHLAFDNQEAAKDTARQWEAAHLAEQPSEA